MQHHTGHQTSLPGTDEGRLLAIAVSCNALFSSACGLALLVGGVALERWLAVPAGMLMVVGAGLVVFAGLLVWLLAQPRRLVSGARLVVAADALWVAGAAALLVGFPSVLSPTGRAALGVASAAVALLAIAQVVGLHRVGAGPVAHRPAGR